MPVSESAQIRIAPGCNVQIHKTAVIDDDVRIVVNGSGVLKIGENTKIGKGTIINCGGRIHIGDNVSVYGYCYFQSSIWSIVEGERVYNHGSVEVNDRAVISPFSVISHSAKVNENEIVPPHSVLGNWIGSI